MGATPCHGRARTGAGDSSCYSGIAAAGDGSCSVPMQRRGTATITGVHRRPKRSVHLRAIAAFTIFFVDVLLLLLVLVGVDNCFCLWGEFILFNWMVQQPSSDLRDETVFSSLWILMVVVIVECR